MKTHCSSVALLALALISAVQVSAQSLVGAWTYGNTAAPAANGTGVIVFLSNGVYFHAESENIADADAGQNGMERGTYSWDAGTSTFTLQSLAVNTNGGWGLSDLGAGGSMTVTVAGGTLTADGESGFTRVTGSNSLVGAWTYGNTAAPSSNGTGVFVFLANGVYFHAESENTADSDGGQNGMERGTYSWNESTQTFTFNSTIVNTNGGWGLSDLTPGDTLTFAMAGNSFTFDSTVFTSVSAVPEPSTCAALVGVAALGLVGWRRRSRSAAPAA